ncbi:CCA tRNA nucleotidyltransferase [Candidatus Gottesmanbacteria bacterium]|nr:CCA tRNA nucleotidyltransferase [Candidatus Gottesmanbacteria bacterium]
MIKISLPDTATKVIKILKENGFECWAVGGCIRDLLLSRDTKGWDFTTNAAPEEIQKIFLDSFYDNKFGTVGIALKNLKKQFPNLEINDENEIYEITTFRSEKGYSDRRHPDKVTWGKTIEEDLKRRDFTINAIAVTLKNDQYVISDQFGGQDDLEKKIIRAVGDPHERFSEDALRLMRAIRFASQLGFTISEQTINAIKQNAKLIQNISWERIRDELLKILGSSYPYEGFVFLKNTNLLKEILPELEACFGIEQKSPGRHHLYDVGTHSFLSLKNCPSSDPITRLATLLHDIGKVKQWKKLPSGTITFYNHEVVGARMVKTIADRLSLSNEQKDKLWTLVRWHQFSVDEHQTDSAIRRFIKRVGVQRIGDMIDLRIGDRLGGGLQTATSWRLKLYMKKISDVQKHTPSVKDLKVNGRDVMKVLNIKPGPKVGEILGELFKEILKDPTKNEKDYLLGRILSLFPEN